MQPLTQTPCASIGIIGVNIKVFGKTTHIWAKMIAQCPCEHEDYDSPHTLKPSLPRAAERCSWQSGPCVHCRHTKMPASPPEYMNYELWLALKAPRDWSNPPLYSRHNLEFDAFMAPDAEIGGRCTQTLNGSLRCDGKNDDCVPCWCL